MPWEKAAEILPATKNLQSNFSRPPPRSFKIFSIFGRDNRLEELALLEEVFLDDVLDRRDFCGIKLFDSLK